MKTFRQLREEWIKSGQNAYSTKAPLNIYINPTGKEIKELNPYPRGFIAPNGKVYVINDGIHDDLVRIAKNEFPVKRSLPIIIGDLKKRPMVISIGDYTEETIYKDTDNNILVKIVKDNPWIKRTFGKVKVTPQWKWGDPIKPQLI